MADISKLNVNNTDYNIKDATARSGKTDKSDLTAISITGTKNDTGSVIPINKFFYLNGELVIAKTDIADNATLTENTNYIKITAGILNGLYNVLQDVTPTSSDKLLVVQSQGQGLVPYGSKLDSANPTGTGSLSLNRKANTTTGTNSVAVGNNNEASGNYSYAEGIITVSSGVASHAEGSTTTSSGTASHAEGYNTTASGNYSHAEGNGTKAEAAYAHAEGATTTASGQYSHSEGISTVSGGAASHAEGTGTKASRKSQHALGEYNIEETGSIATRGTYVEIVGNGTADNARSNARTLDWSGNEVLAGGLKVNGNDDVQPMVALDNLSSNTTTTYTIPSSIFDDYGIYILAFGSNYGVGAVYILMVAGSSGGDKIKITPLVTSTYLSISAVAKNQVSVTAGGANFHPKITRIA